MEAITIKPHHLLDIYKLHGAGIEEFVPDTKYQHDFYRIGNMVLTNQVRTITFTIAADMICLPCLYCKEGLCTDTFPHYGVLTIKDPYNCHLDERILSLLGLVQNKAYSYQTILTTLSSKITQPFINQVWDRNTPPDNETRYQNTKAGITKRLLR